MAGNVVDLLKINIEGGEYELLEGLIASGNIKCCKHVQVQFHTAGRDWAGRYSEIRAALDRTHRITFDEPFCWQNWDRR